MKGTNEIMHTAFEKGTVVPAFNVHYLPMLKPIIEAVRDENSFALIQTCRPDWFNFNLKGLSEMHAEFKKYEQRSHVRLHLDNVSVIAENEKDVEYLPIIRDAMKIGYQSVMVNGSRLKRDDCILAMKQAAIIAHSQGIPIEAQLGDLLIRHVNEHDNWDACLEQVARLVKETGCDWLSIMSAKICGDDTNLLAQISIGYIRKLKDAIKIPLVMHYETGLEREFILEAIKNGVAKVNIDSEIWKVYVDGGEKTGTVIGAQQAVYNKVRWLLQDYFGITDNSDRLSV